MSQKNEVVLEKIKNAMRQIEMDCKNGITLAEKEEIIRSSAAMHTAIMRTQVTDRNCSTCDYCCMNNGVNCCRFRDMAEIPFEVINRVGGCKAWIEKDFIPF